MLSMLINGDVTAFGASPAAQNSSMLTGYYSSSEEEDNNSSSFPSTLVISDAGFALLLTLE